MGARTGTPTGTRTRHVIAIAVVAVAALCAGCATDQEATPSPVIVTVTASATSSAYAAPPTSASAESVALQQRLSSIAAAAIQPVGISVTPVGGELADTVSAGDQSTQVAWSTIKVPLAVAAERENGRSASQTAAITQSDNAAAEALWASLGSDAQASAAVTAVLRDGKDPTTVVPSQHLRAGFTIFGQTQWPLPNAATFTANLPCIEGSAHVIDLMGQVAGNQQWGVEIMAAPRATAVKGGWGPGAMSGYLVRQIGLITYRDGSQTAIALSSVGASMGSGIAALNAAANGLNKSLRLLPRGRCGR